MTLPLMVADPNTEFSPWAQLDFILSVCTGAMFSLVLGVLPKSGSDTMSARKSSIRKSFIADEDEDNIGTVDTESADTRSISGMSDNSKSKLGSNEMGGETVAVSAVVGLAAGVERGGRGRLVHLGRRAGRS